jgi:Coenzyme PQQ synthesis protein D (PqqD)
MEDLQGSDETERSGEDDGATADTPIAIDVDQDVPQARVTVPVGYRPRRREGVLDIDMGDGFILFDDASSLVHHLNPSATLIWQLCDGTGTVADLARDIAAEYELDEPTIRSQVAEVIAEFDALELVEDARNLFSERDR